MAGLRVIAGTAKGRRLNMVPGNSARPIGDRVKEALFNILHPMIRDTVFLDCFAGTGSVGIEALSRGAASCLFLDTDRKAIDTIHQNISICGFANRSTVLQRDAFTYLDGPVDSAFDIVFIAPPQYKGMWSKALLQLDRNDAWIHPDGLVIVQIDPGEYTEQELQILSLYDQRKYGNTLLLFFEKPGE